MLRHTGKKRNYKHNLGLAVLLAFNAGFINTAGFMAFGVLTTNVTGHVALLSVDLARPDLRAAGTAALWLALFLAGSFVSGIFISAVGAHKQTAYLAPHLIILICLAGVFCFAKPEQADSAHPIFAGLLLFSMGIQNAMVTVISGSVVRTTHLTGIFTDLGIDLARTIVNGAAYMLKLRVFLRLSIIGSFLAGGIAGSHIFHALNFSAFLVPIIVLSIAMLFDRIRILTQNSLRKSAHSIRHLRRRNDTGSTVM